MTDPIKKPIKDAGAPGQLYPRRVYPLDAHDLSEEQIAVAFAMTSRRPEAFDEIAEQVSKEKAADFHERWVLGYGHASVAEHAVVHLAVENVSRLAIDTLEDNRLA
ncbi:MAG: FAD-dependent thymidylate synthase, partial [Chloroflexi bacterium]|nr:FAD-dependent thymidylate synthase [Chloroflexota bacterium]